MSKKRYVQVGLGGRARMFYKAVITDFAETSELCAICDINQTRMDYTNRVITEEFGAKAVETYKADQFDAMIEKHQPDVVIVTSIDRTHHKYIIRAMELGCDVVTEKPMTIDAEKCQQIVDTVKRTGRNVRVTFNYRYAPHNTMVRDLIMNDVIGDIYSVHFEWLLDRNHGADYFRRWHRDKRNSGGLMVHKSTHHFDLVNFWLDTQPEKVFAMGDLRFYGRANAEERGITQFYNRAHGSDIARECPFSLNMEENDTLRQLYLEAEHEDGYFRDQSVFGDGISIEDTMAVMVKYRNKALLTYSLNAYLPWEGYNVSFNGPKGRIEVQVKEKAYVNAGGEPSEEGAVGWKSIMVMPVDGTPYKVDIPEGKGGHGGGDPVLLNDIFGVPVDDKYHRAAGYTDGAMSILTGVAANQAFNTGLPVNVADLVKF